MQLFHVQYRWAEYITADTDTLFSSSSVPQADVAEAIVSVLMARWVEQLGSGIGRAMA